MCTFTGLGDCLWSITCYAVRLIKDRTTIVCCLTAFTFFFFLAVLLYFLLEQTSYEHTHMCVFVPAENHSIKHALIVLTQTNVLLVILHSLQLRHSVSCGIL